MIKNTCLIVAVLIGSQTFAQTEIYNEDFQSGLPVSYTIVDNDGLTPNAAVSEYTAAWIELTDPDNASDTIMGSTSFFDPVGQADRWLITPAITLGAFGNHAYWEAKSHDPSFPDDYLVLVSSTDTQISSFTDTLAEVSSELPTWTTHSGNLSELGHDNATIHLAFVNRTNDGFKLYIDDIRVEMEDPASIDPISQASINVYPNPSSNIINVTGIEGVTILQVIGLDGIELIKSTSSTIDISALASGRYFVIAQNETQVVRTIFVKH